MISNYIVLAFNSMPNLIVIFLIIFPICIWVLFVRDECERLVKNQASKVESMDFVTSSWEATHEKATCRAHDKKLKGHARWLVSWVSCDMGQLAKYLRNILFSKKLCLLYQILYPHYIYSHYQRIVRSVFKRENPRKYTWELEIVIPTIIYTFHCGFPQLLSLHL